MKAKASVQVTRGVGMDPALWARIERAWERAKGTPFLKRGDGKVIHSVNGFLVHAIESYIENIEAMSDDELKLK